MKKEVIGTVSVSGEIIEEERREVLSCLLFEVGEGRYLSKWA